MNVTVQRAKRLPNGYFSSLKNQRYMLVSYAESFNIRKIEDFYKINYSKELSWLYKKHNNVLDLLETIFPVVHWFPWKFFKTPVGFWDSINNQRYFLQEYAKELNITKNEDWYKISSEKIKDRCLILQKYSSMFEMLKTLIPNENWQPYCLCSVPKYWWEGKDNEYQGLQHRRQYFDFISKNLNVKYSIDWYKKTIQDFEKEKAISIIQKYYFSSLPSTILNLYPEFIWFPWSFKNVPTNFWKKKSHIIQFLEFCEIKLQISSKDEWSSIAYHKIRRLGGNSLLKKYGTLTNIISQVQK